MNKKSYYEERVNRVLDYVSDHLDSDLSLSQLAKVSISLLFISTASSTA
jgi:YesN/AraC family two-component response regulator